MAALGVLVERGPDRCDHCSRGSSPGYALLHAGWGGRRRRAETLQEALAATYGYNPRLDAERAFQRATDEDVGRSRSGYRPTITGKPISA